MARSYGGATKALSQVFGSGFEVDYGAKGINRLLRVGAGHAREWGLRLGIALFAGMARSYGGATKALSQVFGSGFEVDYGAKGINRLLRVGAGHAREWGLRLGIAFFAGMARSYRRCDESAFFRCSAVVSRLTTAPRGSDRLLRVGAGHAREWGLRLGGSSFRGHGPLLRAVRRSHFFGRSGAPMVAGKGGCLVAFALFDELYPCPATRLRSSTCTALTAPRCHKRPVS